MAARAGSLVVMVAAAVTPTNASMEAARALMVGKAGKRLSEVEEATSAGQYCIHLFSLNTLSRKRLGRYNF
jgi:hypothetical protein